MNKSDLVQSVSARMPNLAAKDLEVIVNIIFDAMTNSLSKGDRIEIRGLGSFVVKEYGAYTGRNPRTGESIQVKPKKLPFFKVGKELKERVDNLGTEEKPAPSSGTPSIP